MGVRALYHCLRFGSLDDGEEDLGFPFVGRRLLECRLAVEFKRRARNMIALGADPFGDLSVCLRQRGRLPWSNRSKFFQNDGKIISHVYMGNMLRKKTNFVE